MAYFSAKVHSCNPYGTNNTINASFCKVMPMDVDPIFQLSYVSKLNDISLNWDYNYNDDGLSVPSDERLPSAGVSFNDQFFVNFETDCKAIRHMSSDGVIY